MKISERTVKRLGEIITGDRNLPWVFTEHGVAMLSTQIPKLNR
jgi:hypothetical protein